MEGKELGRFQQKGRCKIRENEKGRERERREDLKHSVRGRYLGRQRSWHGELRTHMNNNCEAYVPTSVFAAEGLLTF